MSKKKAVWLSRHDPLPAQRKSLEAYEIIQINPPGRYWAAGDAVSLSLSRCGGWPELYVVVLPLALLRTFMPLVGSTPVVEAVMHKNGQGWEWTGKWRQVLYVEKSMQDWHPEVGP